MCFRFDFPYFITKLTRTLHLVEMIGHPRHLEEKELTQEIKNVVISWKCHYMYIITQEDRRLGFSLGAERMI